MASVVKNPDNTFTVTLTAKENRCLARAAAEAPAVSMAKKLEAVMANTIQNWLDDYAMADGPSRLAKFNALTVAKQDQVDALLNGA